jgi:hypothetical protein
MQENPGLREAYPSAAALLQRPATQTSILRNGFRIHYDTTGGDTPALLDAGGMRLPGTYHVFAESLAAAAARVVETMEVGLGYPPPPADFGAGDGEEYDIYVQELDSLYGLTTPEVFIGGARTTTFMQVDNDFVFVADDTIRGLPALYVTLAHEYFHAIQLGVYGFASFAHLAFYEMSSVWAEEMVYDGVNDYYAYLSSSSGHFRRPEAPFYSTDIIMYSRGIWCIYLEERFGPGVIREIWEQVPVMPPDSAMRTVLARPPHDVGFRSAFADWALWNYGTSFRHGATTSYGEAAFYPPIALRLTEFTPPRRAIADAIGPLATRYHRIPLALDSLTLVAVNLDVAATSAGSLTPTDYRILLDETNPDGTYREPVPGLFTKLEAADPGSWYMWNVVSAGVVPAGFAAGVPFPNPLRPGEGRTVFIPVSASAQLEGTLSVFTAAMERIAVRDQVSSSLFGRQVFTWDGRGDDGAFVRSGVYLFVLDSPEGLVRGKIAVVSQ